METLSRRADAARFRARVHRAVRCSVRVRELTARAFGYGHKERECVRVLGPRGNAIDELMERAFGWNETVVAPDVPDGGRHQTLRADPIADEIARDFVYALDWLHGSDLEAVDVHLDEAVRYCDHADEMKARAAVHEATRRFVAHVAAREAHRRWGRVLVRSTGHRRTPRRQRRSLSAVKIATGDPDGDSSSDSSGALQLGGAS